jgi:hypothetical protein
MRALVVEFGQQRIDTCRLDLPLLAVDDQDASHNLLVDFGRAST